LSNILVKINKLCIIKKGDKTMEEKQTKKAEKWECTLCGFVYPVPDLPEDYVCPICGATSDQFEPVE
jgi:rubredoxin